MDPLISIRKQTNWIFFFQRWIHYIIIFLLENHFTVSHCIVGQFFFRLCTYTIKGKIDVHASLLQCILRSAIMIKHVYQMLRIYFAFAQYKTYQAESISIVESQWQHNTVHFAFISKRNSQKLSITSNNYSLNIHRGNFRSFDLHIVWILFCIFYIEHKSIIKQFRGFSLFTKFSIIFAVKGIE